MGSNLGRIWGLREGLAPLGIVALVASYNGEGDEGFVDSVHGEDAEMKVHGLPAPGDYLAIHQWFDESKAHWADVRHRASPARAARGVARRNGRRGGKTRCSR
jgi:hypothetical protein